MTGAVSRARVARVRAAMRAAGADGFVTTAPTQVQYLSGYPLEGCAALVTRRGLWLLPAGLLAEQVRRACPWARVRPWRGGLWATLATVFKEAGVKRIAYEAGRMTVAELTQLRRAAGRRRLIRVSEVVDRVRAVKDREELRRLRRACSIVDGAARLARRLIRPGATEKGVADRLHESESGARLTRREDEILDLLGKGLRNRELGQVLGVTEDTVKTHLKSLFRKLGVSDRAEAVREAMRRGFIHSE